MGARSDRGHADRLAARWYARGARPGPGAAQDPAFSRWLIASPANRAAWHRLAAADRRLALIAGTPALDELLLHARRAGRRSELASGAPCG